MCVNVVYKNLCKSQRKTVKRTMFRKDTGRNNRSVSCGIMQRNMIKFMVVLFIVGRELGSAKSCRCTLRAYDDVQKG